MTAKAERSDEGIEVSRFSGHEIAWASHLGKTGEICLFMNDSKEPIPFLGCLTHAGEGAFEINEEGFPGKERFEFERGEFLSGERLEPHLLAPTVEVGLNATGIAWDKGEVALAFIFRAEGVIDQSEPT